MDAPPPTSVILPTTRWTDACTEVAEQLGENDELLVVCDGPDDPVAMLDGELPPGVRIIQAGTPEGCSGKANAVATGMERATHDRLVWTDDDFEHPPDWLATLHADYDRYGPVSEVPFFRGEDPLATLLEPGYALGGTLGVYLNDAAWGGALMFERDDVDEAALLADLRRSVSDDGILADHCEFTAVNRVREVPIGGTLRETLERHVRFTKITYRQDPRRFLLSSVFGVSVGLAALLFPLVMLVLLTLVQAAVYARFGLRRWTFLLAYPSAIVGVPLLGYALARRTFVWGGRRYRWPAKFDVQVSEE